MIRTFDHLTLGDVLAHRAAADGERPFLTYADPLEPHATRTWTYAECAADVAALQALLDELGVGPGDRVVLHMENAPAFVIALLAITATGAVAVPTIAQYTADELGYVVEHSEAAVVVTNLRHQSMAERVAAGASVPPPVVCGTTVTNGRRRARPAATRLPEDGGPPGRRTALMMYTSGTTGRPKGVMLSHAACLSAGATTRAETALTPSDRSYCVLPLFHVNAMCFQLMPALLAGSQLVIGPVFSARAYWPVVAEHGITVGNLTAGPLRILLGAPPSPAEAVVAASMRLMMYALPLDRDEIRAVETRFGVAVSMGWGLTESAACGTRTPVHLDPRHDWQSIGTVSPGWELRVLGEDGAEVAPGGVGELVIRGPSTMSGYFKDPPATSEVLDADGWLRTGDLGRVDDGYVFFHDRRKDVIKVKGENVGAGEVERVLLDHPLVEECAALGVPDPILGERLLAFVVLAAGAAVEDEALREHCAERLAPFKVPSRIVPMPELPRTSIGKIRKAGLRDLARALA
ncbi:class I adenylate-forming enzyme family protein [Jiangella rhizosphaerae]|uniref:ATP-dependent acyl-CoA ligase n=1 Tax=Jiangella rhizosphaerae TaxID=2293569 RepID=A0A418KR60_9ACTN|nr:class I adenylate-forming enzyme family protein [Jiangella rhizosphaerae]RIQ22841.1 ATP-dependent acyl-CoA ligase [Jiangella rhizosphaerae]